MYVFYNIWSDVFIFDGDNSVGEGMNHFNLRGLWHERKLFGKS